VATNPATKRAIDLSVDAHEFHRVLAMAKQFDRTFYTNLRRDLRNAAEAAAVDVRKEVLKPPLQKTKRILRKPKVTESAKAGTVQEVAKPRAKDEEQVRAQFQKYQKHLRARIAKGVKVRIAASENGRQVGVFIDSKGSDPVSKMLKRSWDRDGGWRHPVFADAVNQTRKQWTWVPQYGRPYFGGVINRHKPQIEEAVRKALSDALENMAEWDRWVARHNSTK